MKTVKEILQDHGVYNKKLELELLRVLEGQAPLFVPIPQPYPVYPAPSPVYPPLNPYPIITCEAGASNAITLNS